MPKGLRSQGGPAQYLPRAQGPRPSPVHLQVQAQVDDVHVQVRVDDVHLHV